MIYTKAHESNEVTALELENRNFARKLAHEAIVLLKNDNNTLPISVGKVALYGSGITKTISGGTGSGEVRSRYYVNVYDGFKNKGFDITSSKWLDDYEKEFQEGLDKYPKYLIKKLFQSRCYDDLQAIFGSSYQHPFGRDITKEDVTLSDTDVCCYVLSRQVGEGKDKSLEEFKLTKAEIDRIKFLSENYEKFILILNTGSFMDISEVAKLDSVNAIVFMCQLGVEAGNALVDVLTGEVTPSGRLSDSWINTYDDVYNGLEYSNLTNKDTTQNYKEGIYVGYRYYSSFNIEVLYPFGYGLSYTTFSHELVDYNHEKSIINLYIKVKNIGLYSGKDVIQVYLSAPIGSLDKPMIELCAFNKTSLLNPSNEEIVKLSFDLRDFASYDEAELLYVLEKGVYSLWLGNNANDLTPLLNVNIKDDINVFKSSEIDRVYECEDELKNYFNLVSNAKTISLDKNDFDNIEVIQDVIPSYAIEKVNELSIDECMDLLQGTGLKMFRFKEYFTVPGAVGNTTSKLASKGIPNIALSDGPAGLRLMKESVINGKKVKPLDSLFELFESLPKFINKFLKGNPKRGKLLYQYATAFPVCNAMAQTFNTELLEEEGYAISKEMKEYGVTFLLAPGINIHRNPLCGRNYEYYSEDPLLSGKLAAAISRGVQRIDGNYVTIKHFACNNQEYSRNTSSSNVSDRALREIYLKPFKIAIKEGNSLGLMTSYNLINGIYPHTNKSLLQGYLREECGYKGLIMTDWTSTGKNFADTYKCIKAGNDLIMPGNPYDRKNIKKAYKNGLLTEFEIRMCAARIIRAILDSNFVKENK